VIKMAQGHGVRRQASGTGAEAAPEILETEDGRRIGTPPRSMASRVGGGLAGAVAGRAASRVLRPVAFKVARRLGLPASIVARGVDMAAPVVGSMVMTRLAKARERHKAGRAAAVPGASSAPSDEPPGPVHL
jgi:hypothetical protein